MTFHLTTIRQANICLIMLFLATQTYAADKQKDQAMTGWRNLPVVIARPKDEHRLPPANEMSGLAQSTSAGPRRISTESPSKSTIEPLGTQPQRSQRQDGLAVPSTTDRALLRKALAGAPGARAVPRESPDNDPPPRPPLKLGLDLGLPILEDNSRRMSAVRETPKRVATNWGPLPARTTNVPAKSTDGMRRLPERKEFFLDLTTTYRLQTPGAIRQIEIADRKVCEAVFAGTREATLIAKGRGTTTLIVWYGTPLSPITYRIHVGRNFGGQADDENSRLRTMIAETFPQSDIKIVSNEKTLEVSGVARSDNEALDILSTIRKLRLIPVVDQVKVRR
jgi:hypothetical protein